MFYSVSDSRDSVGFLMAYFKVELKNNGDKAPFTFCLFRLLFLALFTS